MSLSVAYFFAVTFLCHIYYGHGQENLQNLLENGGTEVDNNRSHINILEFDGDITELSNDTMNTFSVNETDLMLNVSSINETSLWNVTEQDDIEDYEDRNDTVTTSLPDLTSESSVPLSGETDGRSLDGSVMVEDFCLCDLKVGACDINCCCDENCSEEDRKVFSHCQQRPQPVLDPEFCIQEHVIFSNHTEYLVEYIHPGAFCIVTDNLPERTTYTVVKGARTLDDYQSLEKKRNYYSWMPEYDIKPTSFDQYRDGTFIWALNKDGYVYPLGIPVSIVGNECETTTSVLYLRDTESLCHRVLENLRAECESNLFLNGQLYVNLSVIPDPRNTYQNESTDTTTEATVDEPTTAKSNSDTSQNNTTEKGVPVGRNSTSVEQDKDLKNGTLESSKNKSDRFQNMMNSEGLEVSVELSDFWNKSNGQLVPVKTFLCHSETNKDLCIETSNDTFPKPVYENGICRNVLSSITYIFIHNGTDGIYELQAKVYLSNLSDSVMHINQKFSAKFSWASQEERSTFERSGRPGYIKGRPLLMGSLVQNQTEEDVLKEAINLNKYPQNWLTILSPGSSGQCDSVSEVTFGVDIRANCKYVIQQEDFGQDCEVLQERVLKLLLGPYPLNDKKVRIASYGDSSVTNPADWVPILVPEEPQCGMTSKVLGLTTYYNLVTSIHIEVAYSLQGSLANPQSKIVGVSLRYGEPHKIQLPCTVTGCLSPSKSSGIELEVVSSISFVDITKPPLPAYSNPPAIDVKLPYDFFYPFLPSSALCYSLNCFIFYATLFLMYLI